MKYFYAIVTEPETQEILVLIGESEFTQDFLDAIPAQDGATVEYSEISKANYRILERISVICGDSPLLTRRFYYMMEGISDVIRAGHATEKGVRTSLLSAEIMLSLFKKYTLPPDATEEDIKTMLDELAEEFENSVNTCETVTLRLIELQLNTTLEIIS